MGYALEIFRAFLGTFTGALLAFLAFWLREWAERRRAAKEWFLDTFLIEAIEPLIHKSRYVITSAKLEAQTMPDTFDQETYSQVMRVGELLLDDNFVHLWSFAASQAKAGDLKTSTALFESLSPLLLALQDAVLKAKVTRRTSLLDIRKTAPFRGIKKQLHQIDNALQDLLRLMADLPPEKRRELQEELSAVPDAKTKGEIVRRYLKQQRGAKA